NILNKYINTVNDAIELSINLNIPKIKGSSLVIYFYDVADDTQEFKEWGLKSMSITKLLLLNIFKYACEDYKFMIVKDGNTISDVTTTYKNNTKFMTLLENVLSSIPSLVKSKDYNN